MHLKPVESKVKIVVLSSNNRKFSVTHLSSWLKNESFTVIINNKMCSELRPLWLAAERAVEIMLS